MRPSLRISTSLVAGAAVCPFVPLYVAREMTRAFMTGGGGDRITYGWSLRTLGGFVQDMQSMRPEQFPQYMLAVNLGLAVVYAALLAWLVDTARTRLGRRRGAVPVSTTHPG